jgi:hypothetical protein
MRRLAASLILGLLPLACLADFQCNGTVRDVLVYGDGSVNVRHAGLIRPNNTTFFTFVCNLKTEWRGVDTATCAMWTSMLLALKTNGNTAQFYYLGTGSCANLPEYDLAPAPRYIGNVTPS